VSAGPAFVRSWTVGAFTASLSAPRPKPGQQQTAVIEWVPHQPTRLSSAELVQYRRGRDAALLELSAELGADVALVEL
jgi:hypothetical protein